jgi:hypothetical protein
VVRPQVRLPCEPARPTWPRWGRRVATVERMTIQSLEHVGIVVDDLAAATAFFVELGLKLQGELQVEGGLVEPRGGARGRPDGERDGGDPGRQRAARADQSSTPRRAGAATGTRGRTPRASAISHSQSTTSTPLSLACEPAARSSLASWSATETAIGSATSAAPKGSSSSWRSRSAEGSGPPPTASPAPVVVPGQDPRTRRSRSWMSDSMSRTAGWLRSPCEGPSKGAAHDTRRRRCRSTCF